MDGAVLAAKPIMVMPIMVMPIMVMPIMVMAMGQTYAAER
jgi:hypothetical protein